MAHYVVWTWASDTGCQICHFFSDFVNGMVENPFQPYYSLQLSDAISARFIAVTWPCYRMQKMLVYWRHQPLYARWWKHKFNCGFCRPARKGCQTAFTTRNSKFFALQPFFGSICFCLFRRKKIAQRISETLIVYTQKTAQRIPETIIFYTSNSPHSKFIYRYRWLFLTKI